MFILKQFPFSDLRTCQALQLEKSLFHGCAHAHLWKIKSCHTRLCKWTRLFWRPFTILFPIENILDPIIMFLGPQEWSCPIKKKKNVIETLLMSNKSKWKLSTFGRLFEPKRMSAKRLHSMQLKPPKTRIETYLNTHTRTHTHTLFVLGVCQNTIGLLISRNMSDFVLCNYTH